MGKDVSLQSVNKRLKFIVLGNPENRRIALFQQALERFGHSRAIVIPYLELLSGKLDLGEILSSQSHELENERDQIVFRIESPGENFAVEKRLIALGAEESQLARSALRLREDRGRIWFPKQWFSGFRRMLMQIEHTVAQTPGLIVTSSPNEIATMFNKPECHARLMSDNVPVAPSIEAPGSLDDLFAQMDQRGWSRVFVKLAYGSSASGVMALYRGKTGSRAVSSLEMAGSGTRTKFYNSLKLKVYQKPRDLQRAFDFLCREGVHVERWLPKASLQGCAFDLRIVCVGKKPQHTVVRTSRSPITNLHLGNRRGNLPLLIEKVGQRKWAATKNVARKAANCFPNSHCVGVDVLVRPGFHSPTVLEVNAFGDLLPRAEWNGMTTYQSQIQSLS